MKKILTLLILLLSFSYSYAEYSPYNYIGLDASYISSIGTPNAFGEKLEKNIMEYQINARYKVIDLYTFFDSAIDNQYYYGEFNPRLSIDGLFNVDLSLLFIKEWFIAYNLDFDYTKEFGLLKHYAGIGTNLDIPFFDYVKLNIYAKYSDKNYGRNEGQWDGYLLNSAYAITFFETKHGTSLKLSGWLDYAFSMKADKSQGQTSSSLQWKNGIFFYPIKYVGFSYSYQVNLFYSEQDMNTSNSNSHSFSVIVSLKF